jgi:hypothetical protein
MRKIGYLFCLGIFALAGCSKETDSPAPGAGYFKLTQVGSPFTKSTAHATNISDEINFHLGDLKSSHEFYFILSNGGDNAVFDIRLETGHAQFTVSPSQISKLSGRDSSDGFIPLIAVGVIHGRQINGVGFAPLLAMGENTTTLTINTGWQRHHRGSVKFYARC